MITTFWQECQTLFKWQVCCENADRANFSEGTIYFMVFVKKIIRLLTTAEMG